MFMRVFTASRLRNSLLLLTISTLLAGCMDLGIDWGRNSTVNGSSLSTTSTGITLSGSVGDGPVMGATVTLTDADGNIISSTHSDDFAKYQINLPAGVHYPVIITATGGTDSVTDAEPTFTMMSAILSSKDNTAHINPFSTLIVKTARAMPGGLIAENFASAKKNILQQLNFGLDGRLIQDPIASQVTTQNVANIVKSNEALAEMIRRTRGSLLEANMDLGENQIIDYLAGDLTDGVLDGNGAGADSRVSATATLASGPVLVETMHNRLQVNNAIATPRLDKAIQITQPEATQSTDDVVITSAIIAQAKTAVSAALATTPTQNMTALAKALDNVTPDRRADDIKSQIPEISKQDIEPVILKISMATNKELEDINAIIRSRIQTSKPEAAVATSSNSVTAANNDSAQPVNNGAILGNPNGSAMNSSETIIPIMAAANDATGANANVNSSADTMNTATSNSNVSTTDGNNTGAANGTTSALIAGLPPANSAATGDNGTGNNGSAGATTDVETAAGNGSTPPVVDSTAPNSNTGTSILVTGNTFFPQDKGLSAPPDVPLAPGNSGSGNVSGNNTGGSTGTNGSDSGQPTAGVIAPPPPKVNSIPFAADDSFSTPMDNPLAVDVLANDGGIADKPITLSILSGPLHGNATVNADNTVGYRPKTGFAGSDSFTYKIVDADGDLATATVNITINCGGCAAGTLLTLTWAPNPAQDNVLGYTVFFGTTPNTATQEIARLSNAAAAGFDPSAPSAPFDAWNDLGLRTGDTACFRIRAYNDMGDSGFSNTVCKNI